MRVRVAVLCLPLLLSGCLARTLRGPASDHHVQTSTIAQRCEAGVYGPCSDELKEDLESMDKQACLIEAIAKNQDGAGCGGSK